MSAENYYYITEDDEITALIRSMVSDRDRVRPIESITKVISKKYPFSESSEFKVARAPVIGGNVIQHSHALTRDVSAIFSRLAQYKTSPEMYEQPIVSVGETNYIVTGILTDLRIEGAVVFAAKRSHAEDCTLIFNLKEGRVIVSMVHPDQFLLDFELRGEDGYWVGHNDESWVVYPVQFELVLHQLIYAGLAARAIRVMDSKDIMSSERRYPDAKYLNLKIENYGTSNSKSLMLTTSPTKQRIRTMVSLIEFFNLIKLKTTPDAEHVEILDGENKKVFHSLPNALDISSGRLNMSRFVDYDGDFIVPLMEKPE